MGIDRYRGVRPPHHCAGGERRPQGKPESGCSAGRHWSHDRRHRSAGAARAAAGPGQPFRPYPLYAQIREHGVLELPAMHLVVFSDFDSCDEILRRRVGQRSDEGHRDPAGGRQRPGGPPAG